MSENTSPPFELKQNARGLDLLIKWDTILKLLMFGIMAWFAAGKPGVVDEKETQSNKIAKDLEIIKADVQILKIDMAVVKQQAEDTKDLRNLRSYINKHSNTNLYE